MALVCSCNGVLLNFYFDMSLPVEIYSVDIFPGVGRWSRVKYSINLAFACVLCTQCGPKDIVYTTYIEHALSFITSKLVPGLNSLQNLAR